MIKYKGYAITTDGEYPIVNTIKVVKSGKQKGQEVLAAIYFPRDLLGAFLILQRLTNTDASRECKDLKSAIKAIEKNQEELIKLFKESL